MNKFLDATKSYNTFTENGALSHSTTKSAILDYFGKSGTYRGRSLQDVYADVSAAWGESPDLTLKVIFYNRIITRKAKGFGEDLVVEKVQRGQGARDEFRKAIGWVAKYHENTWARNAWLIPVVGCWKDLWHEDTIDVFNHKAVYSLIESGLQSETMAPLVAKYLPRIRSANKTKTEYHRKLNYFARGFCSFMGISERDYRLIKSNQEFVAHQFQRDMSANRWDVLNFSKISGKALFNLVNLHGRDKQSALQRHDQEDRYTKWLEKQPVAKFTGYVYELYKATNTGLNKAQKMTIDKQFEGLLELARKDNGGIKGNVWCALDTSASMTWEKVSPGVRPLDVCLGLGIYFSSLNEGAFKDHVIAFSSSSQVAKLSGTFTDKVSQVNRLNAMGSTNFQSVIDQIVRIRKKKPSIPVEDYPKTLLVVSDMQFNVVGNNKKTNYEVAMKKLEAVGLPRMQIIWWYVTGRGKDFPSQLDDEGTTIMSGFDGAAVQLILGGEEVVDKEIGKKSKPTPWESMLMALNQEVLQPIKI